jgi:hypothetical protein
VEVEVEEEVRKARASSVARRMMEGSMIMRL